MSEQNEYVGTVTSKGQITIPAAVRKAMGVSARDKVLFRVLGDGRVEIEPLPMSLEDAFGSVQPLTRPEDFTALRETARDERAERAIPDWIND